MLKNASKKVFLCDGSKIGEYSAFVQSNLNDIDCLVSNANCSAFENNFPNLTII